MAQVVANTGIKREKGWLYYLDKSGDISRAPMAQGGGKKPKGARAEKVKKVGVEKKPGYLYFIDKKGNVAMAQLVRRKSGKKAAGSTAKKPAAKVKKAAVKVKKAAAKGKKRG